QPSDGSRLVSRAAWLAAAAGFQFVKRLDTY
ncbi:unnamed protein product, partial [marine sediment metagenome]